jgi:hypothetical protein
MAESITVSLAGSKAVQRKLRKPRHTHSIKHRPWQIQPFMIAPVLPGETLKNLLLQARVVTDPIKNALMGWHIEYYYFYVKHRDLAERQAMMDLVMTNTPLTALNVAAKIETYHAAGMPDFTQLALNRVTETYFRDEGEAILAGAIGNLPSASIAQDTWLDSVKAASTNPTPDGELPGTLDDPQIVPGFTAQYAQWEFMKQEKLTDLTYEDFLKTYGVKGAAVAEIVQEYKPELIRYIRDWSYPTNTVDAVTGVPASAVSWAVAERADKDRFFSEPGFIVGLTVARPKIYLSKQKGSGVDMLSDAFSWLPAVLSDDPYTSLRQFANTAGPLAGNVTDAAGYWVDVRDLFIYGDQFVNFALTDTDVGLVALPTNALQKRYATAVDADALFVTPATKNFIRQDGVTQLQILGRLSDET